MSTQAKRYERSGRVGPLAPITMWLGVLIVLPLGFVYTLFIHYNPFVKLSFFGTLIYGAGAGFAGAWFAQVGKSRSLAFNCVAALVMTFIAMWARWVVWTWLAYDDGKAVVRAIALHPSLWAEHLRYTADHDSIGIGTHGVTQGSMSHGELVTLWIVETILVAVTALLAAWGMTISRVYSENTEKWAEHVGDLEVELGAFTEESLKAALLDGQLEVLDQLPATLPHTEDEWNSVRLELHSEPSDSMFRLVSVQRVKHTRKKDKVDTARLDLIDYLYVPNDLFERLRQKVPPKAAS